MGGSDSSESCGDSSAIELAASATAPEAVKDHSTLDESPDAVTGNLVLVRIDTRESYPLLFERTRIGRNRDNDIVIDSDRASRYHAEIVRNGDRVTILDHASRNGVWLNGWRVSSSAEMRLGDSIRIGKQEFTFTQKERLG